jgi:outer membrane protein assembly factor BamB
MTDPQATSPHVPTDSAASLAQLLDAYLADLQAGRAPDKQALLANRPDIADVLRSCLAALDFIHRTAQHADAPAQLGDFRIVGEIGRGGMGVVYEAEQLSLRRRVALKVLRFGGPVDPPALERFRREAETVARLHHTNIVPIFAFGAEQGIHFYAMQLIAGRSLATMLEGPLPAARDVAGWGLQAADALAYAHQRGVVHRDVKPSNLLLDGEGVVWLTDFGLARRTEETVLTAAGVPMGTPRYMSPEQVAAARPVDHRSDVYSLGATLYELATGKPVFDADSVPGLLAKIQEADPVPPRELRPDLPRDLETIVLKCLAKEPHQRYDSAAALADDLRAFREDRAIKARRATLLERSRRWLSSRRFTARAVAVGALVTALAVGLVTAWGLALRGHLRKGERAAFGLQLEAPLLPDLDLPLTAELLELERDERVVPPFNAPTKAPVPVAVGPKRLRLSRPGWLSSTYRLAISPNTLGTQDWRIAPFDGLVPLTMFPGNTPEAQAMMDYRKLYLAKPHLWRKPLDGPGLVEVVPAWRGQDVIVVWPERHVLQSGPNLPFPPPVIEVRERLRLERRAGATGKPLWERSLTKGPLADDWGRYIGHLQDQVLPWVVRTGHTLVFAGRETAALLAIDTDKGERLWCHAASAPRGNSVHGTGSVLEPPLVCDWGKGEPSVIALMFVSETKSRLLRAVSARTGDALWSVELPRLSEPQDKVRPEPALVTTGGRKVVVCAAGGKLFGFDARTGRPAWPARALPGPLAHPPVFADLDGDGNTDALLLRQEDDYHLTLTALDLRRGTVLWEKTWPGLPERLDEQAKVNYGRWLGPDWPMVADLDGDGRPAVIVRQSSFGPGEPANVIHTHPTEREVVERAELLALDGRTGRPRWSRRLARSRLDVANCAAPLRLLLGPDLDGDGCRELFVASVLAPWRPGISQSAELYVDALSGADGQSLWWWRQRLTEPGAVGVMGEGLGRLRWWPASKNGPGLLVVPMAVTGMFVREPSVATFVLAADTGRLRHVVPALKGPMVADLDGDGRPELLGWTIERRKSWWPIRGTAPATIARTEQGKATMVVSVGSGGAARQVWEEPVPEVEEPAGDDPRRRVPLPWERHQYLGNTQSEEALEQMASAFLLGIVPYLFLAVPLGVWGMVVGRRRKRRRGMTDAEIRQREKRSSRVLAGLIVVGLVLTAGPAGIWLWRDAANLAPGETYFWGRWYLLGAFAWLVATLACAGLLGLFVLGRKVVRWGRVAARL